MLVEVNRDQNLKNFSQHLPNSLGNYLISQHSYTYIERLKYDFSDIWFWSPLTLTIIVSIIQGADYMKALDSLTWQRPLLQLFFVVIFTDLPCAQICSIYLRLVSDKKQKTPMPAHLGVNQNTARTYHQHSHLVSIMVEHFEVIEVLCCLICFTSNKDVQCQESVCQSSLHRVVYPALSAPFTVCRTRKGEERGCIILPTSQCFQFQGD